MLDIFNHLSVFGIWFVVCCAIMAAATEDCSYEVLVEGFKLTAVTLTACEILAWSIWYLSGAAT